MGLISICNLLRQEVDIHTVGKITALQQVFALTRQFVAEFEHLLLLVLSGAYVN